MSRLRGKKQLSQKEPAPHEMAVMNVRNVAYELGYNIIKAQVTKGPGIDLEIKNPKNNRIAVVEVETSYSSQIQPREKFGKRWNEIKQRIQCGEDIVFIIFGVTRDLLMKDLKRKPANVPDCADEYGKRVFSCPTADEKREIQAILLRALGDE